MNKIILVTGGNGRFAKILKKKKLFSELKILK